MSEPSNTKSGLDAALGEPTCPECNGEGEILQDDDSDSMGTLIDCEVCSIKFNECKDVPANCGVK